MDYGLSKKVPWTFSSQKLPGQCKLHQRGMVCVAGYGSLP